MRTHKDWNNWDEEQRQKYVDKIKRTYPSDHPYASYQNKGSGGSTGASPSFAQSSKDLASKLSDKPVRTMKVASISLATNAKPDGMSVEDWKTAQEIFNKEYPTPMSEADIVESFRNELNCYAFEISNTGVRLKRRSIQYSEDGNPSVDDTLAMIRKIHEKGVKSLEIGIGGFADVFTPEETQQFREVCKRNNTSLNTNRNDKTRILEHWLLANTKLGGELLARGWRVDGVGCDDIRAPMSGYFKITKK